MKKIGTLLEAVVVDDHRDVLQSSLHVINGGCAAVASLLLLAVDLFVCVCVLHRTGIKTLLSTVFSCCLAVA